MWPTQEESPKDNDNGDSKIACQPPLLIHALQFTIASRPVRLNKTGQPRVSKQLKKASHKGEAKINWKKQL